MSQFGGSVWMDNRTFGDDGKRHRCGVITCRVCHRTETTIADNEAQAGRKFRTKGWLLGRASAKTDVCPGCRNQKQKRLDLSPAAKRAAYNAIENRLAGEAKVAAAKTPWQPPHHPAPPPEPINSVLKEKLEKAMQEKETTDTPVLPTWPATLQRGTGKTTSTIHTTGFACQKNAARSATTWLIPELDRFPIEGIDYKTLLQEDGRWAWHPVDHLPPRSTGRVRQVYQRAPVPVDMQHGAKRARQLSGEGYSNHINARRGARLLLKRVGNDKPVENVDYKLEPRPNGWAFVLLNRDATPAPIPAVSHQTIINPPPAPEQTQAQETTAMPTETYPHKLTRAERVRIIDKLDTVYMTEKETYHGEWSDEKVSNALDLPRAWVAQVREEQFGDHDRNEVAAIEDNKLRVAIEQAEKATARYMEMAAEAEQLANELKQARSRLTKPRM